ncbi:MAG: hypothetical protein KDN05_15300 [Verrucomicrobiae bacterium]|nr:hypothetical protein [Verrucomicrobiae bacterium]
MKSVLLLASAVVSLFGLASCAEEPEPKPVPPTTETSKIPWNRPVAGQGQGQFGLLPQNQYRR